MGYGLVLGGGGAKGAYEIGVWKALREMGIEVDVIVGASVGALNGAIMVQGDYEKAIELWSNLKMDTVISFETYIERDKMDIRTIFDMMKQIKNSIINGGIDITPLKELLYNVIDEERIRASKVDFGIVTFSLSDFKPVTLFKSDITNGMLVEYLLASACFPAFKPQIIEEKRFIDGGVYDNIPISMLLDRCSSIIAIDVSGPGRIRKADVGSVELINVKNSEYLGGTLSFDGKVSLSNIECGYLDTLKAFEKVHGKRYYFKHETVYKAYLEDHELEELFRYPEVNNQRIGKYNYLILKNRIMKQIRQYSSYELNKHSIFMGMLEISAEVLGIDRKRIYSIEELVELLKQEQIKIKDTHSAFLNNKHSLIRKIGTPNKTVEVLIQPKIVIYNMFMSILNDRKSC